MDNKEKFELIKETLKSDFSSFLGEILERQGIEINSEIDYEIDLEEDFYLLLSKLEDHLKYVIDVNERLNKRIEVIQKAVDNVNEDSELQQK